MYKTTKPRFALTKRKTGIIQPEQLHKHKENAMKFLQKKVSSFDIWHKQQPVPPTPPPKKSSTLPNLTIITDPELLMHRALPRLPSIESVALEKKSSGISRATTWVGKSIQKWLSSVSDEPEQTPIHQEQPEITTYYSPPPPDCLNQKRILHCRILQVTNLTSSKSYQYTMDINVTNNPTQIHSGTMKRVAKGLSAAHPRAALSFHVEGPFQFECNLCIKGCQSNTLVGRLKSFRSRSDLQSSDLCEESCSIKGTLCLDSGDNPFTSFASKGIGRYAIPTSTEAVTLELTIAFWLEEEQQQQEQVVTSPIDQDTLHYCEAGDYLTFYVQGDMFPTWNRYWVTFESNHLVLRLNERGGEPVDTLPLEKITKVDINPSDDIKEQVYLGKKNSIILTFENESMYLFCDTFKSMRIWLSLFEQHNNMVKNTTSITKKINLKYLWPSVAQ